ncbi:MAG: AEC family transporter [Gammaproteobacteria bacterium]
MTDLLDLLAFSFSVTGPILLLLIMGVVLRRVGLINDAFIDAGSKLVFNVTLPALLFITISKTSIDQTANLGLLAMGLGGTLLVFLAMVPIAGRFVSDPPERGVVVQGGYRGNLGVIGLAYCVNAYGEIGLAASALYVGLVTIFYNVLAVALLNHYLHKQRSLWGAMVSIAKNPLVIGIVVALPFSYFHWSLPEVVLKTGDYFAQMTLPLALLCTGGSLSFAAMRFEAVNAAVGTLGKNVLSPLLITLAAIALGFRGMELGILFLMAAPPTAAASYVMVRAMGGNHVLAANIIALSTVGSIISTSLGLLVLRGIGLV